MRKNIILTFCAVVIAAFCFCGIAGAQIDYPLDPGVSKLYSYEDIVSAANVIAAKFSEWKGSKLYLLEYAGDARSLSELEYVKAHYEEPYDECMVFLSAFRSSDDASMAWEPNEDYCWSWTLVRSNGDEWVTNNWGWAEYYMESNQYSIYDLLGASDIIRSEVENMEGVKLLNISYTDDERSAANLDYINSLREGKFDECVVFDVWFMSPKEAYGAWEADSLYVWTWYMGRSDKGYWETVTFGVG